MWQVINRTSVGHSKILEKMTAEKPLLPAPSDNFGQKTFLEES
jgi:hypothetical protein